MDILFITYDEPCQLGSPPRPRTNAIRSHARRAVHTRARRERMREFRKTTPTSNGGIKQDVNPIENRSKDQANISPISYLDSLRRNPFQSLAFQVNDTEHLLIDYYVTLFAPTPSRHCTAIIPADIYQFKVTTQWVPFALTDQCLLNGLLLHACIKVSAIDGHPQAEYFGRLALTYKIACIRLLNLHVARQYAAPSDEVIASSVFLTLDELQRENISEATSHVKAIDRMVNLRGGLPTLGLEGFLGQLILLCNYHVGLKLE